MRIRTGHKPEDWTENVPAATGSSLIRGSLVVGESTGQYARKRSRRHTIAAAKARIADPAVPAIRSGVYATDEERIEARREAFRASKRRARERRRAEA